jgi:uncharacterized membrane protein YbhN (UPF0104 family)
VPSTPSLTAVHRRLSSRPVRAAVAILAVALGVWAVASRWVEVSAALTQVSPAALALAWVSVVAGVATSMAVWRTLLAGLGSPLPWPAAARVLFVSQLGKYLPGSVWPMLAQMELGRDLDVPRRRSASAFVLLMGFNLVTALLLACALLPWGPAGDLPAVRWAFVLAPVLLVLMTPPVLNPLLDRALRLAGRDPLEHPLTWRTTLQVGALLLAQWLLLGSHLVVLGADLGGSAPGLWLPSVGGFALAWAVGPLLVVAPAGLGFREVTLVAVLAALLTTPHALVVALLSRVLMTITDLVLAGAGVLTGRAVRTDER